MTQPRTSACESRCARLRRGCLDEWRQDKKAPGSFTSSDDGARTAYFGGPARVLTVPPAFELANPGRVKVSRFFFLLQMPSRPRCQILRCTFRVRDIEDRIRLRETGAAENGLPPGRNDKASMFEEISHRHPALQNVALADFQGCPDAFPSTVLLPVATVTGMNSSRAAYFTLHRRSKSRPRAHLSWELRLQFPVT